MDSKNVTNVRRPVRAFATAEGGLIHVRLVHWRSCNSQKCQTGLMHRTNNLFYSIASSAMASSLSGTVRPTVVAVSRLTMSSILTACRNGKSAGLASLRIIELQALEYHF
jgi:hypothetical protein